MPIVVPTTISGRMRFHSVATALLGSASPMRQALVQSSKENIASANGRSTRCVASGIVRSAEPKPLIPKMNEPPKAISASAAKVVMSAVVRERSQLRIPSAIFGWSHLDPIVNTASGNFGKIRAVARQRPGRNEIPQACHPHSYPLRGNDVVPVALRIAFQLVLNRSRIHRSLLWL